MLTNALKPAWVLSLAILLLAGSVHAANRILIKTVASEEYVKQRAESGPDDMDASALTSFESMINLSDTFHSANNQSRVVLGEIEVIGTESSN